MFVTCQLYAVVGHFRRKHANITLAQVKKILKEDNKLTIFEKTQTNESFKMTAKYILLKMIHSMMNMKFANTAKDELPGR